MITLLLIDDEKIAYADSLVRNAQINDINIIHFQNYEAGFKELYNNLNIQGLIFDAKCWQTQAEQDAGIEPSNNGLGEGLKLLQQYEQNTQNYLPLVVNTGYEFPLQFFKPLLEPLQATIFQKGKTNPDDIFNNLKKRIENSVNYKLERQYADVFVVFKKGYLDAGVENELLNILANMHQTDIVKIREKLASIRVIRETIIQELSKHKPAFKTPELMTQLSSILIHKIGSNYGNHKPKNNDILPSKYTVITLANALMEVLLWFEKEMDTK
jgi:hypothetical protein